MDLNTNELEEYKRAFTEVNDILKFTDGELVKKIPQNFRKFINDNKADNYITNIIPYISLEEQQISSKGREIIALIYRSYFADENELKKISEKDKIELKKFEDELNEKYDYTKMFKKNEASTQENLPVEIKEKNFVEKIIESLKRLIEKIIWWR